MKMITTDPVCGMTVTEDSAAGQSERLGNTYLFCCSHCKSKFDQNPDQFLGAGIKPSLGGCGCGCGPKSVVGAKQGSLSS